jgi:uncharacterized protein YbjT (DUF2867 family)
MSLQVAVMGASGRFGSVVAELLDRGHRVRAVTRDPASAAAHGLRELGAEVVAGDFADVASLERVLRGVDAVIAGGTAHKAGPQGEAQHGINLAEAVAATGAPHLVYVSGAGADRPTGVPVLESKSRVESRLRELVGQRATILAPVYFMENLFNPWNRPALHAGRFPLALPPTRSLQQVSTADVTAFAVVALERAGELAGERIELAGDELTGPEAARALSRAAERDFEYDEMDPAQLPAPGLVRLFDWLAREPFAVDIAALRAGYPEVRWHSFEAWAASQDWARIQRDCLVA